MSEPRHLPIGPSMSPASMAHFVLWTKNLAQMKEWYLKVLGARVVHDHEKICFITYDDEHHRLALSAIPHPLADRPMERSVGLSHVAFTFGSLGELLAKYVELKQASIRPWWTVYHGPTVSMYYSDPDRNNIELQVDAFPDAASASAFMESELFKRNPLGVDFVPEDLIKRYEAGEDERVLLQRPESGQMSRIFGQTLPQG